MKTWDILHCLRHAARTQSFSAPPEPPTRVVAATTCTFPVHHSAGECVVDKLVCSNGIESVWAILKRQIIGIHNFVSPKNPYRYVDEMTWRFNRVTVAADRMNELLSCLEGRLSWKALTE